MEQYIPKSTLVAEIDKGINGRNDWQLDEYRKGYHDALTMFKKYLSILKVKEVDLEKEIGEYLSTYWSNEKELQLHPFLGHMAKHFFELGLNAQCKISYVPNIDDSLEELGVDPTSKEAKIFKESYYIALEKFKAQKGE